MAIKHKENLQKNMSKDLMKLIEKMQEKREDNKQGLVQILANKLVINLNNSEYSYGKSLLPLSLA